MSPQHPCRVSSLLSVARNKGNEWATLAVWIIVLAAGNVWSVYDHTGQVKPAAVGTLVILLSALSLTKKTLSLLLAAVVIAVGLVVADSGTADSKLTFSGGMLLAVAGIVAWLQARRRERLGLRQQTPEGVLELIRDRLEVQAQAPVAPAGWSIEVASRAADGAAISGDFVASRLTSEPAGQVLHLAVVDVSGSGIMAGPPALLLSGAVGGLLGIVPPEQFLSAANDYVVRQHWSLGFASASYLRVELGTGRYEVRVAGHPPALHYRAVPARGQARWRDSSARGTLLGIVPELSEESDGDVLQVGDVLIAYTDGVVEDRVRELDVGITRLKGYVELQAERDCWTGAAEVLVEGVPSRRNDDRTVVVIRRQPVQAAVAAHAGGTAATTGRVRPATAAADEDCGSSLAETG